MALSKLAFTARFYLPPIIRLRKIMRYQEGKLENSSDLLKIRGEGSLETSARRVAQGEQELAVARAWRSRSGQDID